MLQRDGHHADLSGGSRDGMNIAGGHGSSVSAEGLEDEAHRCSTVAGSTDALELLGVFEPAAIACSSASSLSHPLPLLHGLSHSLSLVGHFSVGEGWNPAPLQPDSVSLPLPTLFSLSPCCPALALIQWQRGPHRGLHMLHILSILFY